ncbi:MAG: GNAT family N-acetyltransferase [Lachnospiraceae bacterium]|nr:GNAT family N-acetyltransferase [Lachnospiraceae bacterium]
MKNTIIKNYLNEDSLRHSFNILAKKTFDGLNFEPWYQNGYWSDRYNPYSIVIDGEIAANVSVNLMDFMWNGERKHFIQLGTVMTDERFRNQGLIRQIMNEIDKDYGQNADGFYLFANDSVLDFYPKFDFHKAMEYRYAKPFSTSLESRMIQIPMLDKKDWHKLESAMRQSVPYSRLNMMDNDNLIMFYVSGFMQENVYYSQEYDTYVIADMEEDILTVHNIFSKKKYPMDDILAAFGSDVQQVILGFTPLNAEGYTASAYREDDCTLFVKGKCFDAFERDKVIFPTLSHA